MTLLEKTNSQSTITSKKSPAKPLLVEFYQPQMGTLVKRYKRFFADIRLASGAVVTAHCTNTGSMKSVNVPGQPVIVSAARNPDRKLKFTWEAIQVPGCGEDRWVGVNTAMPNQIVRRALELGMIPEIKVAGELKAEVVVSEGCRLDFAILGSAKNTYIEVKNVTLSEDRGKRRLALFPDSVSERATKHLNSLAELTRKGHRAIVFFVVQRLDCHEMRAAEEIDEVYARTLSQVTAAGVEALAYMFEVTPHGISLHKRLEVKA